LLASRLTNVPGSSDYVIAGAVTYADAAKVKILGVNKHTIKKYGAVSSETAIEMASGIRKLARSDIGLSTTGIAGPAGERPGKPVGIVWIGYAGRKKAYAKKFIFTKDRLRNKEAMSKMAIEVVRRELLNID
jgi:nicotinamide-nucleotide amidase